jgi:fibronectin-binding autotransporter adhesin
MKSTSCPQLPALFTTGLFLLAVSSPMLQADTFVWTGASDGNWNNPLNWSNAVPVGSDTTVLQFGSSPNPVSTNNIPGGLLLNQLRFGPDAAGVELDGNALIFGGAAPSIVNEAANGRVGVATAIGLGTNTLTVFSEPGSASTLDLIGTITGSGGVTVASGTVGFGTANSTYSGETRIMSGATAFASQTGKDHFGASSNIVVEEGGRMLFGVSSNITFQPVDVTNPVTLGGLFESKTRDYSAFGLFLPGATSAGAITLASDTAEIRASGGSPLLPQLAVNFDLTGAVDRAGHSLTVSTSGAGNAVSIFGAVSGDGDLFLDPAGGAIRLSGGLSGNGNLNISAGGGTASISGPVTVGGDVIVSGAEGGVFTLSSLAGDGKLEVGFGGTALDRTLQISGLASGARPVVVTGGTLRLPNANNTFTGGIDISNGAVVQADRNSSLGNAANTLAFSNSGSLEFTNASFVEPLARSITTIDGAAGLGFRGTSMAISSNITGNGGVDLFNNFRAATVTMNGTNTFEGGLYIGPNVRLVFSNDTNLGAASGSLTLGGSGPFSTASIDMPAGYTNLTRALQLSGGATTGGGSVGIAAGQSLRMAGNITGTGVLSLGGRGTFTLAGSNSHTGGIAVVGDRNNPATLVLDSDARLGAATNFLNIGRQSGSVANSGRLLAAADLEIAATRSTTFRLMTVDTAGFNVVFNQSMSGLGMTKTGAGTLTLNTANTDASGQNDVTINQGVLRMGTRNALGTRAAINQIDSGAVLDLNGQHLEIQRMANAFSGSEIRLGSGGTLHLTTSVFDFNSRITGSGSLVLGAENISSQGFYLGGISDFSGNITVHHGASLVVQNSSALGAPGNALTLDNGTLGVTTLSPGPLVIDSSSNLSIGSGGATFDAGGQSVLISSEMSGSSPLRFRGGSRPDEQPVHDVRLLNTANTFTGNITLGDAEAALPAVLGIVADGSLGDAGNVVTLGSSFFDGESTRGVQGGLRAYADLELPETRIIQLGGPSPSYEGYDGFIDTQEHTVTVRGGIGEAAAGLRLLKAGTGTLVLGGTSTYTGETKVATGTLIIDGQIGPGDVSVFHGAGIGGGGTLGGSLFLDYDATFAFSSTETLTVNGASVSFTNFGIDDLIGLDSTVADGTYTLIDGPAVIDPSGLENLGEENAFDLGNGKRAYLNTGNLVLNVVVTGSGSVPYEDWVAYWNTQSGTFSGASALDSADPDGDGLSNFTEFAFGGNPLSPTASTITLASAGGHLTVTFLARVGNSTVWTNASATGHGLDYQIESTTDLMSGFDAADDVLHIVPAADQTGIQSADQPYVRWMFEVPISGARKFHRVKAVPQEVN